MLVGKWIGLGVIDNIDILLFPKKFVGPSMYLIQALGDSHHSTLDLESRGCEQLLGKS